MKYQEGYDEPGEALQMWENLAFNPSNIEINNRGEECMRILERERDTWEESVAKRCRLDNKTRIEGAEGNGLVLSAMQAHMQLDQHDGVFHGMGTRATQGYKVGRGTRRRRGEKLELVRPEPARVYSHHGRGD